MFNVFNGAKVSSSLNHVYKGGDVNDMSNLRLRWKNPATDTAVLRRQTAIRKLFSVNYPKRFNPLVTPPPPLIGVFNVQF